LLARLGRAAVIRDHHSGRTGWHDDFVELKLTADMLSVGLSQLPHARNWRASLLPLLAVVIEALVTRIFERSSGRLFGLSVCLLVASQRQSSSHD
jgi:hypothetical protein